MLERKRAKAAVADAADSLSTYGGRLVQDEKIRRRVLAAVGAGLAARQRAKQQTGLAGAVRRLGSDRVLRAQLTEAVAQLQKATKRVQKKESHKLRNATLFLAGTGLAAAAFPSVRHWLQEMLGGGEGNSWGSDAWVGDEPATPPLDAQGPPA